MSLITSLRTKPGLRRLAKPILAIGVLALLSGCVVYPAGGGYYGPERGGYGGYYHDRGYYR